LKLPKMYACADKDGWRWEEWRRFRVIPECGGNLFYSASGAQYCNEVVFECANSTFCRIDSVL